jgi:hypothetical protein
MIDTERAVNTATYRLGDKLPEEFHRDLPCPDSLFYSLENEDQFTRIAQSEPSVYSDAQFILALVGLCVGVVSLIAVAVGYWR